jgi:CHASE2 domain-containing sensor protein
MTEKETTKELLKKVLAELDALKKKPALEDNGIMKEAVTLFFGSLVGGITGALVQSIMSIKSLIGEVIFGLIMMSIILAYSVVSIFLIRYAFKKKNKT